MQFSYKSYYRFGVDILTMLEIKVLHHVSTHLKVPRWLSHLNTLLTSYICFCLVSMKRVLVEEIYV